jgi:cytochrome c oxidase accessory protein FixG
MNEEYNYEEELDQHFRDRVATIDDKGKRVWIFAKKPKGKLTNYRSIVAFFFLIILVGMPFIRVNGLPFFMLNIITRKFILFSVVFGPQDFFLLGLTMITFMVFIILFTVIFGRLFCGWACPQTIFLEMVFRKIEYFIEGDANKQIALNRAPWTVEKIFKKSIKHFIFYVLSFLIANLFLSYIISTDELIRLIEEPIDMHKGDLAALVVFTYVFYWVFAFFREQVCTVVCPYGRLQGVLLDKKSIVVAYDYKRGEPRGKIRKGESRSIGDCIDCHQCVAVCPTGIDIRNGTQLECVNCTACIDVCNDIMGRVQLPKNLIKYASETGIAEGTKLRINARIIGYSAVLLILVSALAFALISRKDTETTMLRTPGMLYQVNQDGTISNLYNFKVTNKTHRKLHIQFKVIESNATIKLIGDGKVFCEKESAAVGTLFIYVYQKDIQKRSAKLKIGVYEDGKLLETTKTTFLAPLN